jgi:hypothetical protein
MQLVKPVERRTEMERDMDLIRELLLKIDAEPALDGTHYYSFGPSDASGEHSQQEINYHIDLLFESGLIQGNPNSTPLPLVSKLTWQGHEFVDNIRDAGIWKSVKARVGGLPTVALSVVSQVALAEVKKRLGL